MEDSRSGNSDSYCQNSTVLFFLRTFFPLFPMIKQSELALQDVAFFVYFYPVLIRTLLNDFFAPWARGESQVGRSGLSFRLAVIYIWR